jgi:GNAT superfamily N-acetyltransferase
VTIRPVAWSTDLFAPMLDEALTGDGAFLQRLRDEWESGALRFDREGEVLLGAFSGETLTGVGGLSHDPFEPAPGLVRLRHLYVLRAHRRAGIGRALVARLLELARPRFATVRLRTRNSGAALLYESFGFVRSTREGETHRLAFQKRALNCPGGS